MHIVAHLEKGKTMKKFLIPIGLILVIAAGVVKFGFGERMFSERFPDGWTWQVDSLGTNLDIDPEIGVFPEGTTIADDPMVIIERTITASAQNAPAGAVNIHTQRMR